MLHGVVSRWMPRAVFAIAAFLAAGALGAQAPNRTAITGQVLDSITRRPLAGAEVAVVGSPADPIRGARTDAAGRYTITGTPVGTLRVRARALGHAPSEREVTTRANETVTLDFALPTRTTLLDQVVVTGTGGAVERRTVGNVIETIDAARIVQDAAPRSVEQLIGARTPGVVVLPATGQIGTGAQLRVRSVGSLTLSADPIIYIDGVRMDSDVSRGPTQRGGGGASRLNDINPEDIESIEIIKGPAASTLYGTEASNGVVQIITKRGKSGKPTWDVTMRQGTNWMQNPEGRAGLLYARDATTGEVVSFNLYRHEIENGNGPIFQNGHNQGYLLSLSGGSEANRFYLSSSYDNDVGIVAWNWNKKFSARANMDVQATSKLRLQGSIGHIRDRTRLAQGGINFDPFSNLVWGTPRSIDNPRRGFGFSPPELWSTIETHANNDRTTVGLTAMFDPWSFFTHRLVAGLDVNAENNWSLFPRQAPENATYFGNDGLGRKSVERASRQYLTLDYSAALKRTVRTHFDLTTSVGLQHYRSEVSAISASGTTFPAAPITTVTGGASRAGTEDYVANATVGMFAQQQVGWKNRVFLTGALRGDDNSAFGQDYSAAYYPKLSGSWVISEEPWFDVPVLDNLRLRAAYGAAGTQPGTFDAARLYDPSVGYQNAPGLVPGSFGNPQLRPERSEEVELGFETSLLDGRMDVSYTRFDRDVTDAIVNVPVPPSVGFPGFQVVNIGRVKGWGQELAANVRILNGRRVAWEMGTQLASNGNRIEDMGGQQFLTVGGGGVAQNRVGFGIADFFMYRVRSAVLDANGNVLSSVCDGGTGRQGLEMGGPDVPCSEAPRVFWGHSQPTWQVGLNSSVTLWERWRLYARVDGNGGHLQSNTEIRALHNQGSTEAVILRNDPLLQVYRAIEADAPGTYKAGFLRLREVSASYTVPSTIARRIGASAGSISLAGRNLSMLWTAEQGWNTSRDGRVDVDIANRHVWDPEIRAVGSRSNGYQTILPPTASLISTLRLTF